jgi:2-polyprenyl-6-hydroxyphenyl methylase/3-demethylubiquinone-9 3-methyltransferase
MLSPMSATDEIAQGQRFDFGRNWRAFLSTIGEAKISAAEAALCEMLGSDALRGRRLVDVGTGSGLVSLAARRLGATVLSFDYDAGSVECARALRQRYRDGDPEWTIDQGSILDDDYVSRLGRFDIVYAWGVLHHTGEMWRAIENASTLVDRGGQLFMAIYNDQGRRSDGWRRIKRLYCSGTAGRLIVSSVFIPYLVANTLAEDLKHAQNPIKRLAPDVSQPRGMSLVHDWFDWLGGYPYEFARPEEVFDFVRARGFVLERLKTTHSPGCNEFVFRRASA